MALNAKNIKGGGNRKRPPALEEGNYPARLVQLIDIGVQPQRAWQGEEKPPKQEIYTTYEILDEFMKDEEGNDIEDKPRWISEFLPLNSLDSNLAKSTKRYVALDPKLEHDGDWTELMGGPCMITVSADKDKKGKKDDDGNVVIYNNISSTQQMRAKDAAKAEELKNPTKVFDFDDPDMDVFLSLPDWLRDKIKSALNFGGSAVEAALEKIDEDEEIKKRREAFKEQSDKEEPKKEEKPEEEEGDDW